MRHPFLPLVVLLLVPAALAAHLTGLIARRWARWALGGLLAAIVAVSCLRGGVDLPDQVPLRMLLAAAAALLFAARALGVAGAEDGRTFRAALLAVAVLAGTVYLNFLSFHGERTWIHLYDTMGYTLGSKYFGELGYTGLHTAVLRAEAETHENHFNALEARDLETNAVVHIRALLMKSDAVKARFTPERWAEFRRDADLFRTALGAQWGAVLRDRGYNPTPLFTLVGGSVANLMPAGSRRGLLLLTLIDPFLLALLFGGVAWAFGRQTSLVALTYFFVIFGASLGWVGGAFLRTSWLAALVLALCAVKKGRPAWAGALLAYAAVERIFPVLFVFGLAAKAVWDARERRQDAREGARLVATFALAVLVLVGATGFAPGGFASWEGFRHKIESQLRTDATNTVGIPRIVLHVPPADPIRLRAEPTPPRRAAVAVCFLGALAFVAVRSRRVDAVAASALGALLVFTGVDAAGYYYSLFLAVLLSFHDDPWALAVLFAAEAASHALALVENRDDILYLYRSIVLAWALLALYGRGVREDWAFLRGLRRRVTGIS